MSEEYIPAESHECAHTDLWKRAAELARNAEARAEKAEAALREAERNMLGFLQRLTIEGVAVVPDYQAAYLAKDIEAAVTRARRVLEGLPK